MTGILCKSDDDCPGGKCDVYWGTCQIGNDEVMSCIVDALYTFDDTLGQALFNRWEIAEKVTRDRLLEELQRAVMIPLCTGPGSLEFK